MEYALPYNIAKVLIHSKSMLQNETELEMKPMARAERKNGTVGQGITKQHLTQGEKLARTYFYNPS